MSRRMVAPGVWVPEPGAVAREHSLLASVDRQGFVPGVLATTVSDSPLSPVEVQRTYRAKRQVPRG